MALTRILWGIETSDDGRRIPAIGLCECGREVELDCDWSPCGCSREYSRAGQTRAEESRGKLW